MLSADAIIDLHSQLARAWHMRQESPPPAAGPGADLDSAAESASNWLDRVARQHRANFDLWHIEDEARAPEASDPELAAVKRRIDQTNQLRNDLAEELDRALLGWLAPRGLPDANAPLNSESPGLIIDRLSILALKIFHTREQAERMDATATHAQRNRDRLSILEEQRNDLAGCLDALWQETLAGTRRFKLYRQLKMYNDPTLNPAIYRKTTEIQGP
jgi:hypothetical protein